MNKLSILFVLLLSVTTGNAQTYIIQDLGTLDSEMSIATGINEGGEVTGILFQQGKYFFKWSLHAGLTLTKAPDDAHMWRYGMGPFINDEGEISEHPIDNANNRYLIDNGALVKVLPSGETIVLDSSQVWLKPEPLDFSKIRDEYNYQTFRSQPFRVNKWGMVLGRTTAGMAIYDPVENKVFVLPSKLGTRKALAGCFDLNDVGQVTCWYAQGNMWAGESLHGATWDKIHGYESKTFNQVPHLINNQQTIIYYYDEAETSVSQKWYIDVAFGNSWVSIGGLTDINDQGQIAGWGQRSDGTFHAFLLNPMPLQVLE